MTGALWMARRTYYTQNLCLELLAAARREHAYAIMATQFNASELLQVNFQWGDNESNESDEDAVTGAMLLTWLAARTSRLRSLDLWVFELPALPPLPALRHLILMHESGHLDAVVRVLPLLLGLQTLYIFHITDDAEAEWELPLAGLHHLRQVKFDGFLPSELTLSPKAALHVDVSSPWWDMSHPVWRTVLSNLRTFDWVADFMSMDDLPEILKVPNGLTDVRLRMGKVGSSQSPCSLRAAFAQSTYLFIDCHDAWVDVQGGTWRHVEIFALNRMGVSGLHGSSCSDFYLEYALLVGESSQARQASGGCEWVSSGRECLWKGPRECRHPPFRNHACKCGACLQCLTKTGEWSNNSCSP